MKWKRIAKALALFVSTTLIAFLAGIFVGYSQNHSFTPADEVDFLRVTTSNYFKHMSEQQIVGFRYDDCFLRDPDREDMEFGIAKLGVCKFQNSTRKYYVTYYLSSSAFIEFWDRFDSDEVN